MSAVFEAVRDKPLALFPLDGESPYEDYSGYNQSGMSSGTTKSVPLCAGVSASTIFSKDALGKFANPTPGFKKGNEATPFSLESWVYPTHRSIGFTSQHYSENLATYPIPSGVNQLGGVGAGYQSNYFGGDSTPSTVAAGGDGPVVNGAALAYGRKTITTTNVSSSRLVWQFTSANPDSVTVNNNAFPVTPLRTYRLTYFYRIKLATPITVGSYSSIIRPYDDSNNMLPTLESTSTTMPANDSWTRYTTVFTVPDGTAWVAFRQSFPAGTLAVGDTSDVTGLIITDVTDDPTKDAAYFDGYTSGYQWTGTMNASTSITRADVSQINVVSNPAPKSQSNWATTNWGAGGAGTQAYDSILGFYSTVTTAATNNVFTQRYGTSLSSYIPVKPNTTYYMAFEVMSTVDDYRAPFIDVWDFKSTSLGSLYGSDGVLQTGGTALRVTLPANTWQRLEYNFTTPDDASYISVGLYTGNSGTNAVIRPVGSSLYQRHLMVVPTDDTSMMYFDGSSLGALWGSTPNASWSYMLPSDAETQILGNGGQMDGLTIDGTEVSFVTKYTNNGECRVEYDLQTIRRFHVIGVHTKEKNSLYIDGVLVGETGLTDEQKTDTYIATGDGFLYSGDTISSTNLAMNAVAIYSTALPETSPARHFAVGNKHLLKGSMANGFRGVRIPLVQDEGDIFLEQTWTTKKNWQAATLVDVVIEDEKVKPRLVNGVSIAGRWQGLFVMSVTDLENIYGVQFNWDGEGATILASLDGLYWEEVVRGKNLDIIPPGFNPKDKELYLRITFPGGIEDDPSYVDNLTVVGFKTGIIPPIHDRSINFTAPAYTRNDHEPVEYSEDWGTRLKGGYVTIDSDVTSDDPLIPATVEVWLKINTSDAFYIDGRTDSNDVTNFVLQAGYNVFNLTNATAYINGVPRTTQNLPVGEWILLHIIPTITNTNTLYFNTAVNGSSTGTTTGDITIGQVTLYESALTQDDITAIYQSYTGLPVVPVAEGNLLQVAEEDPAFVLVAADWSIVAAG